MPTAVPKALVRKRCFVQMTGYEPVGPEHQHRRFIREMARFQKAWNVAGTVSPPLIAGNGAVASWTRRDPGPELARRHRLSPVPLGRLHHRRRGRERLVAFSLGIAALMEFVLTGTVVKYFIVAWRYGGFFLYPFAYLLGMGWLAIGVTRLAVGHLGLPYPLLTAPLLWLAIFVLLRWTFGRMVHIRYALDDWYFARDLVHRARPEVEARLDLLARELLRIVRETDADEIVFDGHSLGAPLSIAVVDRALALDPHLGGKPLHLVSSGSSLLKVALHPAAGWLREAVGRVANAPPIYWVEYQALVDIINVYKVDPVVALGMAATGKPIVRIIRIRLMVEEHTYRMFRLNFLRIHRQAVMGNERRYFYDYYMLCCGPIALTDRVENPDGAVTAIAADGGVSEMALTTPLVTESIE